MEIFFCAIIATITICLLLTIMILLTKQNLIKTHPCSIQINNDEKLKFSVPSGSNLLDALANNDIILPASCGGKASCNQCKIQITQGSPKPLDTEKGAFTNRQLQRGWHLACQVKVHNDLQANVDEQLFSVKQWNAKVISNNNVATFIKEIIVEVPETIPYRPGSYFQWHIPPYISSTNEWRNTIDEQYHKDWKKYGMFGCKIDHSKIMPSLCRAYSVASYPAEGKIIKFNIRIASPPLKGNTPDKNIPWGICSSYAFSLKSGDEIVLSGPYGDSFMIDDARDIIFLIGGAGSSFGRSHIMDLFYTQKTKRQVTLWYGARALKENIYQNDFECLTKEFSNFNYHLVLSEPSTEDINNGWPCNDATKTNYLFKAFEQGQLKTMDDPEECLYYVCGPPMHNTSVIKLLDGYGVPQDNIILDDFGS